MSTIFINPYRHGGAVGDGWWTAGGVTSAVGAYQAKGAADQATSYINLANPGTNNLTLQGTGLTWDTTNGWGNNFSVTVFLKTGITPAEGGWSMLARWSNGPAAYVIAAGTNAGSGYKFALGSGAPQKGWFFNGGTLVNSSGAATPAGVFAVTNEPYVNGVDVGTLSAPSGTPPTQIAIGGAYWVASQCQNAWTGYIQAVAIYNTTLTPTQVSDLTTAMSLL